MAKLRLLLPVLIVLLAASCSTLLPGSGPAQTPTDSAAAEGDAPPAETAEEDAADTGPAPPENTSLRIRPIARGEQCAVRTPTVMTISSQTVLEDVWAAIHSNKQTAPRLPGVDFSTETVILLILGERPSGGYSVRAVEATRTGETVRIQIRITEPGPEAVTTSALTSPFELTAVAAAGLTVVFTGDDVREGFDPL